MDGLRLQVDRRVGFVHIFACAPSWLSCLCACCLVVLFAAAHFSLFVFLVMILCFLVPAAVATVVVGYSCIRTSGVQYIVFRDNMCFVVGQRETPKSPGIRVISVRSFTQPYLERNDGCCFGKPGLVWYKTC